jgi:hypothetical protein
MQHLHVDPPAPRDEVNQPPLPRIVYTVPVEMAASDLRGMASRRRSDHHDIWMVVASRAVQPFTLGRLLGALLVDWHEQIVIPPLMPRRPPLVYVLPNGDVRQGRGRVIAPWAISEIDRIAHVLSATHLSYFEAIIGAFRGDVAPFTRVPADFIIADTRGSARLGPPPGIRIDCSRLVGSSPTSLLVALAIRREKPE